MPGQVPILVYGKGFYYDYLSPQGIRKTLSDFEAIMYLAGDRLQTLNPHVMQ